MTHDSLLAGIFLTGSASVFASIDYIELKIVSQKPPWWFFIRSLFGKVFQNNTIDV